MWFGKGSSAKSTRMETPKTGVGSRDEVSHSPVGVGSGEGAVPPPQKKNFVFSPLKWCVLMHSGGRLDQL